MRLLDKLWALFIAFGLGAFMVVLTDQYAATLRTFIICAVMFITSTVLTLCTLQVRMMDLQPRKKKLPRGSRLVATSRRGKLKVVEK